VLSLSPRSAVEAVIGVSADLIGSGALEPDPAPPKSEEVLRFRGYTLTPGARSLLRDNEPVPIGDRAFDLLYILATARGQVVERLELMRRVWPTTLVAESNLRFQVKCARRALGEDGDLIKSVTGRGYFFVAERDAAPTEREARHPEPAQDVRLQTPPERVSQPEWPADPTGAQSPEDYRASCELLRELLTSVLEELRALRDAPVDRSRARVEGARVRAG